MLDTLSKATLLTQSRQFANSSQNRPFLHSPTFQFNLFRRYLTKIYGILIAVEHALHLSLIAAGWLVREFRPKLAIFIDFAKIGPTTTNCTCVKVKKRQTPPQLRLSKESYAYNFAKNAYYVSSHRFACALMTFPEKIPTRCSGFLFLLFSQKRLRSFSIWFQYLPKDLPHFLCGHHFIIDDLCWLLPFLHLIPTFVDCSLIFYLESWICNFLSFSDSTSLTSSFRLAEFRGWNSTFADPLTKIGAAKASMESICHFQDQLGAHGSSWCDIWATNSDWRNFCKRRTQKASISCVSTACDPSNDSLTWNFCRSRRACKPTASRHPNASTCDSSGAISAWTACCTRQCRKWIAFRDTSSANQVCISIWIACSNRLDTCILIFSSQKDCSFLIIPER